MNARNASRNGPQNNLILDAVSAGPIWSSKGNGTKQPGNTKRGYSTEQQQHTPSAQRHHMLIPAKIAKNPQPSNRPYCPGPRLTECANSGPSASHQGQWADPG